MQVQSAGTLYVDLFDAQFEVVGRDKLVLPQLLMQKHCVVAAALMAVAALNGFLSECIASRQEGDGDEARHRRR